MTELAAKCMREEPRFRGLKKFHKNLCLSSPTMHGEELEFINQAFQTNQIMSIGENIDRLEDIVSKYAGVRYAVALNSGTAAIHLAVKLVVFAHLYGFPGQVDVIKKICEKHDALLIEDAAESPAGQTHECLFSLLYFIVKSYRLNICSKYFLAFILIQ